MSKRNLSYEGTRIASAATTQVKSGNGVLKRITFGKPIASSTVTIYDETGADTTEVIDIITNTADVKPYFLDYDLKFTRGLKIVTSAADFITVVWE